MTNFGALTALALGRLGEYPPAGENSAPMVVARCFGDPIGKPEADDDIGDPTDDVRQEANFISREPTFRSRSPTMFNAVMRAVGVSVSEDPTIIDDPEERKPLGFIPWWTAELTFGTLMEEVERAGDRDALEEGEGE